MLDEENLNIFLYLRIKTTADFQKSSVVFVI